MLIPTRDNVAVLFLDFQDEIVTNSATMPEAKLRHTAGALARLAALHALPCFLSAVPPGGRFFESVTGALDGATPRPRTHTTAFADTGLADLLRATGRRVLILAGVASEIVVHRTALDALAAGYEVQVAVDACGGVSARTEEAAFRRIAASGGVTTSVITFGAELAGDFTSPLGGQTLGIIYELLQG